MGEAAGLSELADASAEIIGGHDGHDTPVPGMVGD
ncbi:hypothetical protein ENSA5_06260 [Enhygromyxa salina]|uniref:Uncharacterized protein n=1 Tax=Enhygromyxa salina TaxID=215803 RepID=A0A2S9YHU0_9BACT|nr:hypothetical protein ENSA5_06260 [Enhygromyxa salina]